MKRIVSLLVVILILVGMLPVAFAGKNYEATSVDLMDYFTKEIKNYTSIHMIMGGDEIVTEDVPAILYVDGDVTRAMVPVNFISSKLGGKMTFDWSAMEATILYKSKRIVLKMDSSTAYVNGVAHPLPDNVPAKLLAYDGTYRALVPVRFLEEIFDLEVFWDNTTKTLDINKPQQDLKSISYDWTSKFQEIRFKTTGEVDASHYFVEGSSIGGKDKIVLELQNVKFDLDPLLVNDQGLYKDEVGGFEISKIQAFQSDTKPYKVRVDVDLNMKKEYDVWYDYQTNELVLQLINSVWDISTEDIYSAKTVVIETGEEPAYNVTALSDKVIVDVINAKLRIDEGKSGIMLPEGREIRAINYMQFEPSGEYEADDVITRVVISLGSSISTDDVYVEAIDDKIYIYVSGNPLDGFNYAKQDIDWASLNINLNKATTYSTAYNANTRVMTLKIPKNAIELDALDIDIDDNIIELITIDKTSNSKDYVINFTLAKGTEAFDQTETKTTEALAFSFINNDVRNSIYRGKLIVIDPGHGGKDPGARGANIDEADINLTAAKLLRKKLEALGFSVYMTRESDKYVGLYNRPQIANDLNADAFISIHANASTNTAAMGIETLFYPEEGYSLKRELARAIQNKLIAYTGAVNRGIVERPNLVVTRETHMPSVIVEMGFLTNVEEEAKLMDANYLDTLINAVRDGILMIIK
ncbi:MAG: N-acetylmuramoyl-L-alanine amidase [Clostridia bacterium]|nr:N-acetylmuramoyl-L-alanine amidase [Clostridia bacterium]